MGIQGPLAPQTSLYRIYLDFEEPTPQHGRVTFPSFQPICVWRRGDGEEGQEGWKIPALPSLEFSQPAKSTKTTPDGKFRVSL